MSKSVFSIGFILGIILGGAIIYGLHAQQITDYNRIYSKLDDTESELETASAYVDQLEEDYEDIEEDYIAIRSEINTLRVDYSVLERENQDLKSDLDHADTSWYSLSDCVIDLIEVENSYFILEEAFSGVINDQELEKIANKIEEVSKNEEYNWDGYWNIHKYVRDEIQYSYDPEIPAIGGYRYYGEQESPIISEFEITTRENLLQSLSYTVEYKQGDCDDQALLEYAMIQYYRKYIYGTIYGLYLARITFDNGDGHLAVFVPVQDGNICILDPAGQYQTGTYYGIQSKKSGPELYNYEDHWEDENGGINEITLWNIDIDTGDYVEWFKGSITEAVVFFSD